MTICRKQRLSDKSVFMEIKNRPNPNEAFPNPKIPSLCFIKNVVKNPRIIIGDYTYYDDVDGAVTTPITMMWMVLTSSRSMSLISMTS